LIPRIRIAHLPTLIEPLPRLSAVLGGPRLWVKRDDQTGLALGGNKVRKLEYVLAEAQANGAKTLVTVGAAQSNHCRQTAALAARFGLGCILVLSGDSTGKPDGNLLLDHLFGAEIQWAHQVNREVILKETFDRAWNEGRRPFLIPLGASTPIGTIGYVTAFEEFLNQGIEGDWIIVASSSAGTQAGLVLGARRAGWGGKILGITIDQPVNILRQRVANLANEASARLGENVRVSVDDILVNGDYLGAGYGILNRNEIEAIHLFAKTEGLVLDPVYTCRAAAALIDLIRKGYFAPKERVLFWHTGGIPALFSEKYANLLTE